MIVEWSAWRSKTDVETRRPVPFRPDDAETLEEIGGGGSWPDEAAVLLAVLRRAEEASSCGDLCLDDGDWFVVVWWLDDGTTGSCARRLRALWTLEED